MQCNFSLNFLLLLRIRTVYMAALLRMLTHGSRSRSQCLLLHKDAIISKFECFPSLKL
jgi:hypothetical protein